MIQNGEKVRDPNQWEFVMDRVQDMRLVVDLVISTEFGSRVASSLLAPGRWPW